MILEAFKSTHHQLDSQGEDSDDDYYDDRPARGLPPDAEDEASCDPDDYGFYDGTNRFYIRVGEPAEMETLPRASATIPGAMDIFCPENEFRLGPGQTRLINLGFGLIVPRGHVAVLSSREMLSNNSGVVCFETILGPGT